MKTLLAGMVAIFVVSAGHAAPPSVNPEPLDVEADTLATIGKEKAKQRRSAVAGKKTENGSNGSSECGNVNINSNDNKSNSGIKDMFGKKSTTIVTGPVINMANCK